MLLAVDIGNTDIVLGIYAESTGWINKWRHPSASWPELKENLDQHFDSNENENPQINRIVLSSVVPKATQGVAGIFRTYFGIEPLIMGPILYNQLPISIDNPSEIGSDLVANSIAAYEKIGSACLVIDFGTALTFTAIAGDGAIMGVAISPGLDTAMKALFQNTAQLPVVPLELPDTLIGKNTVHALQAGVMGGYIGLVKEIIQRIQEEMGEKVPVIATGGLVYALKPLHSYFSYIDQGLTLEGLRLIADRFS